MNFNYSFNSSFGNHKQDKRKLSAQEEYWLDRILRNHSGQIFIIILLFFALIIGTVIFAAVNQGRMGSSNDFSVIQINR